MDALDGFFDVTVAPLAPAAPAQASREKSEQKPAAPASRGGKNLTMGSKSVGRRFRKVLRDNILGVTNAGIRRLARRGGIKRIAGNLYDQQRVWVQTFLRRVLPDAVTLAEGARRRTVTVADIVGALRRQNIVLYSGL